MCNYKTLVHNDKGYIIKCLQCERLQLAFGTTVVSMDEAIFSAVTEHIATSYKSGDHLADKNIKRTSIPVDNHTMICLTYPELASLQNMFMQANAILDTYRILEHC